MSSMTYAHHDVGSVRVCQDFYTPGPYDAIAYGSGHRLATPCSTYYVWTGLAFGQPDEYPVVSKYDNPEKWSAKKLRQVVEAEIGPLPKGATISIWSPDGEGALYLEFKDEGVEEALAFAQRRSDKVAQNEKMAVDAEVTTSSDAQRPLSRA